MEKKGRIGNMQTFVFGIAVPAIVFIFSFYITDRLYKHFSRRHPPPPDPPR